MKILDREIYWSGTNTFSKICRMKDHIYDDQLGVWRGSYSSVFNYTVSIRGFTWVKLNNLAHV